VGKKSEIMWGRRVRLCSLDTKEQDVADAIP
jgi:hypothetical protein